MNHVDGKTRDQSRRRTSAAPDQFHAGRHAQRALRIYQRRHGIRHSAGSAAMRWPALMIGYVDNLEPLRNPSFHVDAELSDRRIRSRQLARDQQTDPEPGIPLRRRDAAHRALQPDDLLRSGGGIAHHGSRIESSRRGGVCRCGRQSENRIRHVLGRRSGRGSVSLTTSGTTRRCAVGYGIYYDPSDVGVVGNAVSRRVSGQRSGDERESTTSRRRRGFRSSFCEIHFRSESRPATGSSQGRVHDAGPGVERHSGSQS